MAVALSADSLSSTPVLTRAWRWLQTHESEQAAQEPGRWRRVSLGVVVAMVIAYTVVLTLYTFGLHDTFATHAEDLGIMDQALWNTAHGHFLYETICNPIGDLNCQGGVIRFAIHFEPILIPIALLYLIAPQVKLLLFLQVVVVASGAFPAYLLAVRRLGHPLWGILFAALFLVYPPLTAAVVDDFHPEAFAATILLWAFYCLAARRYRALIVWLALALLCKETMALDVIGIGLFVALVHRRVRLGAGIVAMGALTLGLALILMHVYSPLGHSPVVGRFSGLSHAPVSTLLAMAHDSARRSYLVKLLGPLGFLPLLSPWIAVIALPSLALNLLSSDPLMYSGLYQYNTDIAAVFIAASVDAMVWVAPIVSRGMRLARERLRTSHAPGWLAPLVRPQVVIAIALIPALLIGLGGQASRIYQQLTVRHIWPVVTQHDRLGASIAAEIPAGASVSAQSTLAPHLSQRMSIYQFPSGAGDADYVFLDVTTGNFYPFTSPSDYVVAVQRCLNAGGYRIADARDGYLLLRRISNAQVRGQQTPGSFYSFAYADSLANVNRVDATFAGGLRLVGYQITPRQVYRSEPELTITTYWTVSQPISAPQTVVMTLAPPHGSRLVFADSLTQEWLPPSAWAPNHLIRMQTWPIYLDANGPDAYTLGVEVRDGAPGTHPAVSANVAVTLASAAGADRFPQVAQNGNTVLLTVVPLR